MSDTEKPFRIEYRIHSHPRISNFKNVGNTAWKTHSVYPTAADRDYTLELLLGNSTGLIRTNYRAVDPRTP
jgi:hypothetical protein